MPLVSIGWKTPYKIMFKKVPKYDRLRVMDCLCYGASLKRHIDKFDAREVYFSRDIAFQEDQFPFKVSTTESTASMLEIVTPPSRDTSADIDVFFSSTPIEGEPETEPTIQNVPDSDEMNVNAQPVVPAQSVIERRSNRERHTLTWSKDYVMVVCDASNVAANEDRELSTSLTHALAIFEPSKYKDAQGKPQWEGSMKKELDALEANGTWVLTSLTKGHVAIGSKWVYKVKFRADGSIERHKAKGFNQKLGKDYKHTFSPVVNLPTVRIVLPIATAKEWPIHQLDVNNAFLHGFLDEEIYMKVLEGYEKASPHQVCKLQRSLYGLKQTSRQWNQELTHFLVHLGYKQSTNDYSLFTKINQVCTTILLVYVDDILITVTDLKEISEVNGHLHKKFTIKDLVRPCIFKEWKSIELSMTLF
ncbi:hypothetical protein V2J09_010917 [Rumex salicifolius]